MLKFIIQLVNKIMTYIGSKFPCKSRCYSKCCNNECINEDLDSISLNIVVENIFQFMV